MKEAFQQQHEEEGEMIIGPTGRPMLTPDAMQRKMMRDRAKQEEVRSPILPVSTTLKLGAESENQEGESGEAG
jgi:hypothetical protein